MTWFLSLFAAYRTILRQRDELRATVRELAHEKLMLQDRLDSAINERQKLWDMTRECVSNERAAYQMQINAQWQKQGFGAPYPEAPKLPPSAEPSTEPINGPRRPVFASTRVQQATTRFIDDFIAQPRT